jgi:hypothetical protein
MDKEIDDRRWVISGFELIGSELHGAWVVNIGFSVGEWTLLVGRADGNRQYPFRQQQQQYITTPFQPLSDG